MSQEFLAHDEWALAHLFHSNQEEAIRHQMGDDLLVYAGTIRASSIVEQTRAWDRVRQDLGVVEKEASEFKAFLERFLVWKHDHLDIENGVKSTRVANVVALPADADAGVGR